MYSTERKAWRWSVWLWPCDSLCSVTTSEACRIWHPTNVNLSVLNSNSPSAAMTISLFWQQCHCYKLTTPFVIPCSPDSGTNPLPVRRSRAIVLDQSPTSRPCLVRPTAFSIPGDGTIEFRYFLLRIFPLRIQKVNVKNLENVHQGRNVRYCESNIEVSVHGLKTRRGVGS